VLAAVGIAFVFILLNHTAYDGFFQDDELDNLNWAPSLPARVFFTELLKPTFAIDNFRPAGHFYFKLMGSAFGLNFAPYITPIFALHFLNALLLFLLMRKLAIKSWSALAAVAFFTLSASAFDAYWKPMYVFDLLCTTFSLGSILLYAYRRWVFSFIAFWCAYKSKELAVMLPAVLAVYEYLFGERRFKILMPFFLVSLSFGIQGLMLNPNKDNDYTFRFTPHALAVTIPFYAKRFLLFPFSGILLLPLILWRDRRILFALAAMVLVMIPLIFLPGRLFEAYTYLPLACASVAMAAAASRFKPIYAWVALALWMPHNVREIRHERRAVLEADDAAFAFVDALGKWTARHPDPTTLIYQGQPLGFNFWGPSGAWNIIHHRKDLVAFPSDWPQAAKAISSGTVAYGTWNQERNQLTIELRASNRTD
jgi:hypothetical protein